MSNRKVIAAPGSKLGRVMKEAERCPSREVTIVLRQPHLTAVNMVAEVGNITLEDACVAILTRAIDDAVKPLQGRALEVLHAAGGSVVPDPDEK